MGPERPTIRGGRSFANWLANRDDNDGGDGGKMDFANICNSSCVEDVDVEGSKL